MHRITSIDVHVAGEPLRVITSGFPELPGRTILEKRLAAREQYDHLRTALLWEPRGHPDMYGCALVPSSSPNADLGVLFLHNDGYSTMCGHGIIGLTTVVLEHGIFPMKEPETLVRYETPSGLVTAKASVKNKRVRSVSFLNVPSFVSALDQAIEVSGLGSVRFDVAFGGAFYAFCRAQELGLELKPASARQLVETGMRIKEAVAARCEIRHPLDHVDHADHGADPGAPALSFLYGTIFVGPPEGRGADCRHVCIFADGALDRSPTGTGVSAHLALRERRKQLQPREPFIVESILGTRFLGRIHEVVEYGGLHAVVPEVEGQAYLTGKHEFFIDPDDPLQAGFLIR